MIAARGRVSPRRQGATAGLPSSALHGSQLVVGGSKKQPRGFSNKQTTAEALLTS